MCQFIKGHVGAVDTGIQGHHQIQTGNDLGLGMRVAIDQSLITGASSRDIRQDQDILRLKALDRALDTLIKQIRMFIGVQR